MKLRDMSWQNAAIQKKIFPSRLVSMSLNPGLKSKQMDGICSEISRADLTKLQLSDGTCLYAKLVVILCYKFS